MLLLLARLSWPELRHHPWRNLAALVAVMLGVALAYSVHLINASALAEFGAAIRNVNGEPDLQLVGPRGGFDEAIYERVAGAPEVEAASPIVEGDVIAEGSEGARIAVHVVGRDVLASSLRSPTLLPQLRSGEARFAALDPEALFLNGAAEQALGTSLPARVLLRKGTTAQSFRIAGRVGAAGKPLAVLDIAGAQALLESVGRLSRIDLHLVAGADRAALLERLRLPSEVRAITPGESSDRIANVSRAYRVNLTVLALVAMFTGAFLVFSILSLSVAKRQQQLALLGVLGLAARDRRRLVLGESALIGAAGSVLGLGLGAGLATLALQLFGGDLGGGYFAGLAPRLHLDLAGTLGYGGLGIAAALVGGWLPARAAERLVPAQALKGYGGTSQGRHTLAIGIGLVVAGVGLAALPPIAGLPLAAYLAVACLLLGGIACVPGTVGLALAFVRAPRRPLALLAIERARHERDSATIAVAGVVASLALSIALTVMVGSFREGVVHWLDTLLPADVYVRVGGDAATKRSPALPLGLAARASAVAGVLRAEGQRMLPVQLDPARPPASLIARRLGDVKQTLPLLGSPLPAPPGTVAAFVSEAFVALYDVKPGARLELPLADGGNLDVFVVGVWRDYLRQSGAVVVDIDEYRRRTGDETVNNLALWLDRDAGAASVESELRRIAGELGADPRSLEVASTPQLRVLAMRLFDRSFAVTYWLQAVAIGIGLFGIAASFSAQVLARRREFGLLGHLGLTRRQIVAVVAAEGAVWTSAGALLGLVLGLAVSVVLVEVVNPQSFHWSMELVVPWARLAWLCAAVVAAGTVTAWLAAGRAAGRQSVLAVNQDW